jgi:predicted acyl esterase
VFVSACWLAVPGTAATALGSTADNLSETPASFAPRVDSFDYVKREIMIPMRDGVKLHTLILIPRGAARAPMLLTRTPYGAVNRISAGNSAHLSAFIDSTDVADDAVVNGGYIRVVQDIRGKHGSEGDYVMTRPLQGPLNPTLVDHATDTYDTIDWLVKNVPESNGKVAILGISYDGFTALMALVNPHPALRAAVPINAMADGWMGDDWFHGGAFRQDSLKYAYDQEATGGSDVTWWSDYYDDYDTWLATGSVADMAAKRGVDQVGFANHIDGEAGESSWQTWLVSDQRDAAARTDVLSFSTPVLDQPIKVSGEPIANLVASTSGTDGDFVVKLIDVFPNEVGRNPKMGGYQLMVAADILRGRYRESFSDPKPIPAGKSQVFRFALPTANHVFLSGHRIMVQVQSTWFPIYDRNPQTYVENIFFAKPGDYKKATIKIFDGGPASSFVDLPVVEGSSAR